MGEKQEEKVAGIRATSEQSFSYKCPAKASTIFYKNKTSLTDYSLPDFLYKKNFKKYRLSWHKIVAQRTQTLCHISEG